MGDIRLKDKTDIGRNLNDNDLLFVTKTNEDTDNPSTFGRIKNQIISTATGITETRYANLSGATFSGNISANTISATTLYTNNITSFSDLLVTTPSGNTLFLENYVWRDEYPGGDWVPASGSASPDLNNYTIGGIGTRKYGFDGGTTEERLSSTFEIPHDYALGQPIEVHVHWRPSTTNTGTVVWWFDWSFDAVYKAPSGQTSLNCSYSITGNSQYYHIIKSFGFLPTNINYQIGDMINFNIRRTPNFSGDTYPDDVILEQVALHIPIDTLGSRQIYIK